MVDLWFQFPIYVFQEFTELIINFLLHILKAPCEETGWSEKQIVYAAAEKTEKCDNWQSTSSCHDSGEKKVIFSFIIDILHTWRDWHNNVTGSLEWLLFIERLY